MGDDILKAWYAGLRSDVQKGNKISKTCPKCTRLALTHYERTGRVLCQMCGFQVEVR